MRADLLEIERGRGRIIGRTRFPATIAAITSPPDPNDPTLMVTLAQGTERVTVPFRPGAIRPGRGIWDDQYGSLAQPAWDDAKHTVPGYDRSKPDAISPAVREASIAALARAEALDPTNPFLPAFRGELLAAAGRPDDAAKAFSAAAEAPGAAWADLLWVSSVLEDADAREPAQSAFACGFAGMQEQGVRPERLFWGGALHRLIPKKGLKRAVQAGNADHVHEVASRLAMVFPRAENMDVLADGLTVWMRERGRADLAAEWTARAAFVRTGIDPRPEQLMERVRQTVPFFAGMMLAAPLVALAAGHRRGADQRKRQEASGMAADTRWLTRPRVVDVISILAPLCVLFVLAIARFGWWHAAGIYATMPLGIMMDGAASPKVQWWVAWLPPSAGRDRLLDYVRREAQATRAGGRDNQPPPDDATLREAVETVPIGSRIRHAVMGGLRRDSLLVFEGDALIRSWRSLWYPALAAIVMFVLGGLLGRWIPKAMRVITWLVPGGPAALSAFGGLIGGLMIAHSTSEVTRGALYMTSSERITRLVLLEPIGLYKVLYPWPAAPGWASVTLALCLVLHAGAAFLDARRVHRGNTT